MQLRQISFKLKLIIFLEIFFIAVNAMLGVAVWKQLSAMVREISRSRLKSIAASAASLVQANQHEILQDESDEDKPAYIEIQTIFKKIMSANDKVDDIYTLRPTNDNNLWTFVVSASDTQDTNNNGTIEEEEQRVVIGEEFDASDCPELLSGWTSPSADYKTNCDKWGCWLSGYAPVKDENNNPVAVVGVDISANDILAFEKETRLIIIITIAFITILLPVILYPFMIHILRPISTISDGVKKFSHDLSTRINLRSQDEFGLIANTFNNMAKELQDLYLGLEARVKEKTSELKKTVDEIKKEKAKDEALLGSIGEGMIATDKKGIIIIINQQTERFLGYSKDELLGQNAIDFLDMQDDKGNPLEKNTRPLFLTLKQGKKITSSNYYIRKNGTPLPVMVTASPVLQNKRTIGSIVIFRDISKEKEIDKAKSEFVSLASHQLRTPLSSINWYTEMLLDGQNLTAEQKNSLSSISEVTAKMVELVNALLNVSRLEMGTFIIEPEPINLAELAKSVLDEINPTAQLKQLKLIKDVEPSLPLFNGDPKLLRIIFQNLLTNAVKYTPKDGMITFNITSDKENIIISVSDTGYGIPDNQADKIFTKLFRADNIKTLEVEGTGLGLYIVKSIIENSGGQIYFESKIDKGTTFYVIFPKSGMQRKTGTKKLS